MNSLKRNYELALEALEELAQELAPKDDDDFYDLFDEDPTEEDDEEPDQTPPRPAAKPLSEVLEEFGDLPPGALFLGVAYDELPILLNLNDPTPGPILIMGDEESGKRNFLKMVGQSIEQIHSPRDVQFGVISSQPKEWKDLENNQNCMGIFPSYQNNADDFIRSLADWAHHNHSEKRFALLLIDDLELVMKMNDDVQQALRWLLLRGPNRRVWPLATLNAGHRGQVLPWMDAFRTRLFGAVKNLRSAEAIVPTRGAGLHLLEPGEEFILYENRQWVKFWIPSID